MAISKVVVVDGNNLIVRIDRGVAGRGVTDVEPIEIDGSLYLVFTFSDGTTETVGPVGTIQYIGQAPIVVTGSTISLSTVPVNLGGTGQTTANAGFNALAPTQTGNAGKYLTTDGSNTSWANNPLGTVTSVDMTVPTGLTVSGNPITTSGTLAVALQSGYSIPTTASQTNWDTAYSERQQWNGGATNLVAATGRTSLGLGTIATQDASAVAITGGSITGITDLAVADGGTGASTAAGAMVNLLPSYTGNANKRLGLDSTASGLEWVTDGGGTVTSVDVSGGTTGLSFTGGPVTTSGTITLSGTLDVDNGGTGATTAAGARTNLNAADQALTLTAGTGLSGGGDLSANRTFSITNTGVTAASYGSASNTLTATVNAQGQLTALAATPIAISNTQVSGLGTMSTQNSNAVTITGGSITGITDLAIADGGTGASNAADARSNLGLGTAAVLNAGVALGVATLDAGGTVPLSQIPASIQGGVSYQGAWNASTNTPTLTSSVGTKGHYYVVSVAGNTNLNGVTDWLVGDWAIYNGTAWEKIDNTDQVASVNGYTGVVVLTNTDVGAPPTSLTISAGTGLSGGGNLTTNRTLLIANTAVSAGSYGTASAVPSFTVNGQGQLTAASDVTIAISNAQVSGLGTMSTQNANNVSITGGSITGITDLAIADGGTGASTAGGALTNLGAIGTITSTDGSIVVTPSGTTVDLAVSAASPASTLLTQVRNTTGATLTKGTVVYISGATGQIATVSKAIATGDATSAQTLGMITSDLANNSNGYVTVFGLLENIDTSSYTDGAQLYLSGTTAGAVTATKPSAPTHLVYVAVVEYAHPTQGKLLVKVQNGYELDEIHDVSIVSPVTGQTLVYNATTDLWVNNTVSLTAGVNGTLPIANGGTGQTTANAAFNALAPSQTGNSGKYLTTDGTDTSWASNPLGTVTSVGGTGTVSGITLSGTVTTSGNLTLGGALDLSAYNGAGAFTTLSASSDVTLSGGTANGVTYLNGSKVLTSGSALTFNGTSLGVGSSSYGDAGTISLSVGVAGSTTGGLQLWGTTTTEHYIQWGDSTTGSATYAGAISYSHASDFMRFWTNSTEQMRLTSTSLYTASGINVSIGTSTNAAKLYVYDAGNSFSAVFGATGGAQVVTLGNSGKGASVQGFTNSSFGGYADLILQPDGKNVGLGVTPSATWFTGSKVFQIGTTGALWNNGSNQTALSHNAVFNNSDARYLFTEEASYYSQLDGQHRWFTAPSGTAGDAISFSQAMTLAANAELNIDSGTGGGRITFSPSATRNQILSTTTSFGAYNILRNQASSYEWLNASSTQMMTLNSSGQFSLGTTGAVSGTLMTLQESASNGGALAMLNRNSTQTWKIAVDATTVDDKILAFIDSGTSTVRMALTDTGNLGLGVTPSAWVTTTTSRGMQFGRAGSIFYSTDQALATFGNNNYQDGTNTFKYLTTGYAQRYAQSDFDGSHKWFTAPSGTAGDAISFSQAMTLLTDTNGTLLLGTTSSTGIVSGTNFVMGGSGGVNQITFQVSGSRVGYIYNSATETAIGAPSGGSLKFQLDGGGTKATIDSSGNLLVGTTNAGGNGWTLYPTGSGGGVLTVWNRPTTANTTTALEFRDGGTATGSITYTNTATAFNTSSDYRLKNTIAPMTGALAKVAQLKPVTYKWNADGSDGEGFIAHELAEVVPQCVTGEKDAVDENGNPKYQGIDTSFLVATLTAALQELNAKFDAYVASHP